MHGNTYTNTLHFVTTIYDIPDLVLKLTVSPSELSTSSNNNVHTQVLHTVRMPTVPCHKQIAVTTQLFLVLL